MWPIIGVGDAISGMLGPVLDAVNGGYRGLSLAHDMSGRISSDLSALRAARAGEHAKHVLLSEGRNGAGDEKVILRAMAKRITWGQAAEIIGISDRSMRRWRERYEEFGFRGLFDRRRGKPSPKWVAVATVEKVTCVLATFP